MSYELDVFKVEIIKPDNPRLSSFLTQATNARRLSAAYSAQLNEAAELILVLSNRDRFFLFPDRGAVLFQGTTLARFQYGYEDADHVGRGTRLSPWRTFPFSSISMASEDSIEIKFISPAAQVLTSIAKGAMFDGRSVSSVLREALTLVGYDESHLWIQDTKFSIANLVITGQDSFLGNIIRIGKKIGFVYYESISRVDGKTIIHFHKPGWEPTVTSKGAVPAASTGAIAAQQDSSPAYDDPNDGMFANRSGAITYLPIAGDSTFDELPVVASNIMNFSFRFEANNVPAKVEVQNIDLTSGKSVKEQLVSEGDLTMAALSKQTPYGDPEAPGYLERIGNFFSGSPAEGVNKKELNLRVGLKQPPTGQTIIQVTHAAGVQPEEQALAEGKATLADAQAQTTAVDMTLVGEESIDVGQIWILGGFGFFDGDYLTKSVRQEKSVGGYVTTITCSTDGVDSILGTESRSAPKKKEEQLRLRVRLRQEEDGTAAGTTVFNEGSDET